MVHLSVFNQTIVILNDPAYAIDMLDKKSRLYSDRPTLTMAGRLIGWEEGPALMPFCDRWSEYRKMYAQFMGTKAKVERFGEVLEEETRAYLRKILEERKDWAEHSRKCV